MTARIGDPRPSPSSSENSVIDQQNIREVIVQMNKVVKLLQQQRSTITYIHQFGVWFLGVGVVFAFYYNYVLLEPILWSLFGVLFSYVALYPPKVKVLKALVYLLGPRDRSGGDEDADDEDPCSTWHAMLLQALAWYFRGLWRLVWFLVIPSGGEKESSVYFSMLYRLMFVHIYQGIILGYFPETSGVAIKLFVTVSVVIISAFFITALRRSVMQSKRRRTRRQRMSEPQSPEGASRTSSYPPRSWTKRVLVVQDQLGYTIETIRVWLAKLIFPNAHLISTVVVLLVAFTAMTFLAVWTVYAFSDEVVYIYRNIATLVRALNHYLSHFSSYTIYVNKAYKVISGWISSAVMADSASTKTRALYEYFTNVSLSNNSSLLCESSCGAMGNATRAVVAIVHQDLESLMEDPYCLVHGFWELTEYYHEELQSGGTISRGGDYLLTLLNYLKYLLLHSSSISFAAIGSGVSVFTFLFDSLLQAFIYITVLFLLLQSNVGLYRYAAVMLHFVDPSAMLYRSLQKALRAILISSIKMAVFHACFTWLLFSFCEFPLVVIPTVIAFILGMVPIISPVVVTAIPLPIFVYVTWDESAFAAATIFSLCFLVWWFVGPAIYAEIPDSSVWVTTFSVGLGISLFGARGVVIGPAIATIPFALYGLGSAYISSGSRTVITPTSSPNFRRKSLAVAGIDSDSTPRIGLSDISRSVTPQNLNDLINGSGDNSERDRKKLLDFIMSSPKLN